MYKFHMYVIYVLYRIQHCALSSHKMQKPPFKSSNLNWGNALNQFVSQIINTCRCGTFCRCEGPLNGTAGRSKEVMEVVSYRDSHTHLIILLVPQTETYADYTSRQELGQTYRDLPPTPTYEETYLPTKAPPPTRTPSAASFSFHIPPPSSTIKPPSYRVSYMLKIKVKIRCTGCLNKVTF